MHGHCDIRSSRSFLRCFAAPLPEPDCRSGDSCLGGKRRDDGPWPLLSAAGMQFRRVYDENKNGEKKVSIRVSFALNLDVVNVFDQWGIWLGALAAGAVGSVHCMAMCSPLVCVVCTNGHKSLHQQPQQIRRSKIPSLAVYLAARLCAYTTLGFASGMAGAVALGNGHSLPVRIVLSAVVIASCLLAIKPGLLTQALPAKSPSLPGFVSGGGSGGTAAGLLGLLTPLLPCGLLWSIALLAAQSGSPLRGAAIMAVFAVGSAPGLALGPSLMRSVRARLSRLWPYVFSAFVAGAGGLALHRIWMVAAAMPCH